MSEQPAPLLRVVRGEPTAEELAALVAVLASRPAVDAPAPDAPRPSAWTDRARYVRRALPRGPGAWKASSWRS